MATYEFSCLRDGVLTTSLPLGQAPPSIPCPTCGALARRRFSVPQLRLGDTRARRLITATEATATEPAVVSSPSGHRRATHRRPVADPRTAHLPRT
jgi:hypothetical protein